MSTYRDEQHAAVRAMSVDAVSTGASSSWQKQYSPGFVESETARPADCDSLNKIDRLLQDSMTRSLIHKAVTEPQWLVLVALYSTEDRDRVGACERLAGLVVTPGDALFRGMAVGTWAFRHIRKEAKNVSAWDLNGTPERTLRRWRKDIRDQLDGWRKDAMTHLQHVFKDAGLIGGDV